MKKKIEEGIKKRKVNKKARRIKWKIIDSSDYNPEGQGGCSRLWAAGIDMLSCAENIAHGHQSPQGVLSSFMGSPGHRANILMDGLTHLGVGVHTGAGGPWWTLDFVAE